MTEPTKHGPWEVLEEALDTMYPYGEEARAALSRLKARERERDEQSRSWRRVAERLEREALAKLQEVSDRLDKLALRVEQDEE